MRASINPDLAWYVARSKPGKTFAAATEIRKAGFDVYCPAKRCDRWHKKAGVRIEYDRPLMPPYVFVGFRLDARHFEWVRACDGVSGFLVSAEGTPLGVPVQIINAIFLAEINMEYDETDRAKKARQESVERMFPPGSAVKLLDDLRGILAGLEGKVIETKRDRVHVEFGGLKSWIDGDKLGKVEAA